MLDYQSSSYQFPAVPRAPRTIRRRCSHQKSVQDGQICAFELLATVAGKLLQESESSTSSNVLLDGKNLLKKGIKHESAKSDCIDQGSCIENVSIPESPDKIFCKQKAVSETKGCDIQIGDSIVNNTCGSKDSKELCIDTNIYINSDSSVQSPLYKDSVQDDSFPIHSHDIKIDSKFAEENVFEPQSHTRYCWNVAPKLMDCERSNKRKRFEAEAPLKKRKWFDNEASSESISNQSKKGVKFSIKSFTIPELYVEVPESATVGALKRTIMDAVTAILGGELHVGVLLQGEKVGDDNKTLFQSGISHCDDLDNLGFLLEPSFPQDSSNDSPTPLTPKSLSPSPIPDKVASYLTSDPSSVTTSLDNHDEIKHEVVPCDLSVSKAIVPVTAIKAEALSLIPFRQKISKASELSQRRTRRPFSVPEVEALVEAVEKLGTGRWRDVKIRSFSDADHRTYVDLKDKWKTLVHTASIAPQQRRGEAVPQQLLDRVLGAHAYWSRHHQSLPRLTTQDQPLKLCVS